MRQYYVKNNKIRKNRMYSMLTSIYLLSLLLISCIACFFSYSQRKTELLAEIEMTFMQLENHYKDTIEDFWQIYMPIYEKQSTINTTLENYFTSDNSHTLDPLDPFEKMELKDALSQMMIRDNQIQWIAVYSPFRDVNYILFNSSSSLQEVPGDFPYLKEIESQATRMAIYGREIIVNDSSSMSTFAVCGGISPKIESGNIIVGYSTSSFERIIRNNNCSLSSLNYLLVSNDAIVYDSSGAYNKDLLYIPEGTMKGTVRTEDGQKLYVHSKISGNSTSVVSYTVSWSEIFLYSHKYTLPILLIVLAFAAFSIVIYTIMLKTITKEVEAIRQGLKEIGDNHLDHKIPTLFKHSDLSEIAEAINYMTSRLKENINRVYYYKLKQRDAELSELQSKFNPHFLYNSLEMLRSRCYKNNDVETAELIMQLASIFRGLIGSENFIPLRDELTFSQRYLSLFGTRYNNKVKVRYDIDTEVLQYGIIRNIFQPLIENYFVHGFDVSESDSYILFRGKSQDEETLIFTVEDNGIGMSDEEITQLNTQLHQPIEHDKDSYGLKNLHQRLRLFYGDKCGISLQKNNDKGLSIQIVVLKMTCEEYAANN